MAIKGKVKSESVAEKQLCLLTDLKVNLYEAQDNLADESHQRVGLEKIQKIQLATNRKRTVGQHVGSSKWPVHIVFLICDIIVNGTPSSAITANIQKMSATMTGCEVNKFSCINLCGISRCCSESEL